MARRGQHWSAPILGGLCWCAGCSGPAFQLDQSAQLGIEPDSGALPPLVTTDNTPPPPEVSQGAGGAGGGSSAMPDAGEPDLPLATTGCGPARVADADLADNEVCIRAGSLAMGSAESPRPGYFAHGPVHTVTLSAYFLDAYEVTVARYRRCVADGGCTAPSSNALQGCTYTAEPADRERLPVTCVSWPSAQEFCAWDGGRQLPTEAQWEQAARTSAGSKYPWGDAFSCERAVLAGASQCTEYSGQLPREVGSARSGASPERAYDLSGNAAEWVADWFGSYSAAEVTDPSGPATGSLRIQRGGGWLTLAADATSYARRGEAPAAVGPFSFRCARPSVP